MIKTIATAAAIAACAPAAAQFAEGAFDNARIVGVWSWTYQQNKCVETYDFRADGSLHIQSGDERTESSFRLHAKPSAPTARHALNVTVRRDYGGKDCLGQGTDDTGVSNTLYVQFAPDQRSIIICFDAISNQCMGPLARK